MEPWHLNETPRRNLIVGAELCQGHGTSMHPSIGYVPVGEPDSLDNKWFSLLVDSSNRANRLPCDLPHSVFQ
jgi:hypothetical protein